MLSDGVIVCDSCATTVLPPAMLGGAHICELCRARRESYYDRLVELLGDRTEQQNGSELRESEHQCNDRAELLLPQNNYASRHCG